MPVNMEVCVFQWDMVFNVSVQQDFLDAAVRLISTNVHHSHVTMVVSAKTRLKAINVNAPQDTVELIVKKKSLIAEMTLAQLEPCVKMNLVSITLPACVEVDTLEKIAM
jgi:hypothetical protein